MSLVLYFLFLGGTLVYTYNEGFFETKKGESKFASALFTFFILFIMLFCSSVISGLFGGYLEHVIKGTDPTAAAGSFIYFVIMVPISFLVSVLAAIAAATREGK